MILDIFAYISWTVQYFSMLFENLKGKDVA